MDTMDRAYELAEEVKDNEVYSVLAEAQLEKGMVKEAIRSYIKAENHKNFSRVISASIEHQLYENLIHYLVMCRVHCKHPQIEGELMYAYAITENLSMLQELVSTPNVGQTQEIANRCYQKGLYKAAKLLFNSLSNYSRLCSCLIKLDDYESAVDAARKASNTQTWKEINLACIDTGKFSLAQICGIHLMQHGDELGELIHHYEQRGYFEEVIDLLEKGIANDRSPMTVFTYLAVMYSKYAPPRNSWST